MSRPIRLEFSGAVYHVVARGNEQRDVFRDDDDRDLYLRRLAHYQARFRFRLYAYCLMSNHVHLALETGSVPLSRVVLSLHGSYAQAFNQRHERVGHLFQGRYKAFLVQKASYLLSLVRYIHENPVKAGIVANPQDYRWSSDRFYRGGCAPDWLDIPGLFQLLGADPGRTARRYRDFMLECEFPRYEATEAVGHLVKGDDSFARAAFGKARHPEDRRPWTVEEIARVVARKTGVGIEEMRTCGISGDRARARAITGFIASRHARIPLTRTAVFFGRDGTTLVKGLRQLEAELRESEELRRDVYAIVAELGEHSAIQR